jgi:hypothetical protein
VSIEVDVSFSTQKPNQGFTSKRVVLTYLRPPPTVGHLEQTNDKKDAPDRLLNLISSGSGRRVTGVAREGL